MEQKRTLWIVAAVGVFLLVVLGAALILYTPQSKATVANSRGTNDGTASNGWISLAPSAQLPDSNLIEENKEIQESADFLPEDIQNSEKTEFRTDEVNIYAEKANVYSEKTDLNKLGENATVINSSPELSAEKNAKNTATTIDLTESEKVPAAKTANSAVSNAEPKKTVAAKNTSATEKTVQPKAAAKPEQKAAPKTVKTESKKPAVQKPAAKPEPEIVQYWVQVTALTSRKAADEARSKLDENQITADVFTYTDSKKQLFYRVRVGPYTTKSEAEYWRTKISKIDSFQNTSSYITSTTVAK